MQFIKDLMSELIPAMLCAVVAGLGAYVAVKSDITTLTVNQGIIIESQKEGKQEAKEVREDIHKQAVRLAVLENAGK